jgi:hypothetical protein
VVTDAERVQLRGGAHQREGQRGGGHTVTFSARRGCCSHPERQSPHRHFQNLRQLQLDYPFLGAIFRTRIRGNEPEAHL